MKFLTSILGTERDRINRRRRSLEVSLHRHDEKIFMLEMELEETKRQKQKIIDELRGMIPARLVSTVSVDSAEFSFNTSSSNDLNERFVYPVNSSTPRNKKQSSSTKTLKKVSYDPKSEMFKKEEEERVKWLKKQQEKERKLTKPIEKY